MLIKLINNSITNPDTFKAIMVINSNGTGTLKFFKILDFKSLDQLTLNMKLGDADLINSHVSHRYKQIRSSLEINK